MSIAKEVYLGMIKAYEMLGIDVLDLDTEN